MRMISYIGIREADGTASVYKEKDSVRTSLSLRLDLRNHSPTGPEWGYGGSGPAQLALAILCDWFREHSENASPKDCDEIAANSYQFFKHDVVANLPRGGWVMTEDEIGVHLTRILSRPVEVPLS